MEDAVSEEAKAIMLRIVEDYARLARLAEDAAAQYSSIQRRGRLRSADRVSKKDRPT